MGFKRPLVRLQSLGPFFESPENGLFSGLFPFFWSFEIDPISSQNSGHLTLYLTLLRSFLTLFKPFSRDFCDFSVPFITETMNCLRFLRCQSLLFQALTALFLSFPWDSRDHADQVLCADIPVSSTHAQCVRHADLALGVEVSVDVGGSLDV